MIWNPFDIFRRKPKGAPPPPDKPQAPPSKVSPKEPAKAAAAAAAPALSPDEAKGLEAIEKKGLLPKFFRHWKDPAFLAQVRNLAARMAAEGVNVKDRKAVEAWITAHQADIEAGKFKEAPGAKPRTYVKTGPETGRNDPCPCGSGKKFKKCCASKAA